MFDEPKKDLNPYPAGVGGIAKKSGSVLSGSRGPPESSLGVWTEPD